MREPDLVVVGGGPRALMALLALDAQLGPRQRPVQVVVVDPAAAGAGAVWNPEQPEHLLMNVNADIVDLSGPRVPHDFRSWARTVGSAQADTPYPPRALVGQYLAWCFERLLTSERLSVQQVRGTVTSARYESGTWTVQVAGDKSLTTPELLLCTGHRDSGGIDHRQVMAGHEAGEVVVRGAALTAIDVVLDLTAGRGGRWEEPGTDATGRGALTQPLTRPLTYRASGREPSSIVLLSRSGELLVPKPRQLPDGLLGAVGEVTRAWRTLPSPDEHWWDVLIEAARAAASAGGVRVSPAKLRETLAHGRGPGDSWARWRHDLARADGALDDDAAWWLGRAWSAGYRDLVRGLERAERDQHWPEFLARAARLERWAFGPPAHTVRRLLALHDAGLLHLRTPAAQEPVHVEAVTAPPGVSQGQDPLWAGLLQAGRAMTRPGERGVWTTPRGQCVAGDGAPTPGLWALGRPTEDPVIGHDTLSRSLHRDVDAWAAAMAHRLAPDQQARDTTLHEPEVAHR